MSFLEYQGIGPDAGLGRLEGHDGGLVLAGCALAARVPLVAYHRTGYFELGEFVRELGRLGVVAPGDGRLELLQEPVDVEGVGVAQRLLLDPQVGCG